MERRGQDEWHFNVLLRCLVTSTIDHSAAAHTPLPHCPADPHTALGKRSGCQAGNEFPCGLRLMK